LGLQDDGAVVPAVWGAVRVTPVGGDRGDSDRGGVHADRGAPLSHSHTCRPGYLLWATQLPWFRSKST